MQITARRFDFRKLVLFHGWTFLPPFSWDDAASTLDRPLRVGRGRTVDLRLRARQKRDKTIVLAWIDGERALARSDREAVRGQVRRMLCLDQDFSEFHDVCRGDDHIAYSYSRAIVLLQADHSPRHCAW